jgi:hypothetical protein
MQNNTNSQLDTKTMLNILSKQKQPTIDKYLFKNFDFVPVSYNNGVYTVITKKELMYEECKNHPDFKE